MTEAPLQGILDEIAAQSGAGSGAVVVRDASGQIAIVASVGLDEAGAAGLTAAINRPGHTVARTFDELTPTFDVRPMNPGGPALRSHLPLVVDRDGKQVVVGVLALAHDDPVPPDMHERVQTAADLAAAVVEHERAT